MKKSSRRLKSLFHGDAFLLLFLVLFDFSKMMNQPNIFLMHSSIPRASSGDIAENSRTCLLPWKFSVTLRSGCNLKHVFLRLQKNSQIACLSKTAEVEKFKPKESTRLCMNQLSKTRLCFVSNYLTDNIISKTRNDKKRFSSLCLVSEFKNLLSRPRWFCLFCSSVDNWNYCNPP